MNATGNYLKKKGKRGMAKEIHKAKEKNKQSLHEQLNEREKLEAVQLQEQHTATELI